MDETRPDLPELESVQTRDTQYISALVMLGGMMSFSVVGVVLSLVRYHQYLQPREKALALIVPAGVLYILIKILSSYSSFKTDPAGLTLRGPLRRKFIPWINIREAATVQTRLQSILLLLKTDSETIKVNPRGYGVSSSNGEYIIASIWQHLRRFGHAAGIQLSESALTLWAPIPDSVPYEIEWGKPATWVSRTVPIFMILFFIGLFSVILSIHYKPIMTILMALMVCSFAFAMKESARMVLHRARVISIKREGLEAELLYGKTYIPWSSVTSTRWYYENPTSYLVVESRMPKGEVYIPLTPGNTESESLIQAVIRYLRKSSSPQAVLLPVTVTNNLNALKRTAYTDQQAIAMKRAYINALQEPLKSQISRLYRIDMAITLLGIFTDFTVMLTDGFDRLIRLLHSSPDNRFLITCNPFLPLVCIFMGGMVLSMLLGDRIAYRLSSPVRSEWKEFQKVGAPTKTMRIICYFIAFAGIFGFLISPLYIDCYMRITDRGIAVNRLFEFRERVYSWSQVEDIKSVQKFYTDHGKNTSRYYYTLNFKDGTHWKFSDGNTMKSRKLELQKAAEFVASKLGKQLP